MNRRHVDPPPDVDGDDDLPVVVPNDVMSDTPVDDIVIDLRDPPLGPRLPTLPVAIDVSSTLAGEAPDGAQRLVIGLTTALADDDGVELQLLDGSSGQLRELAPTQQQTLMRRLERAPSGVRRRLEQRLAKTGLRARPWEPTADSWFIDIGPAWLGPMPRAELLPELEAVGVQISAFVPDLDRLHHPEWFTDQVVTGFRQWLRAHRTAASTWLAASVATADDLVYWLGPRSKNHEVKLLTLGVGDHVRRRAVDRAADSTTGDGRLLMVGPITTRGGHRLILEALDLLVARRPMNARGINDTEWDGPVIDVVGTSGSHDHDHRLRADLEHHCAVRLHDRLSDSGLERLWREASFLLAPDLGDGVGLSVVEALARSVPVVATNLPALAEASQGLATAVAPDPVLWADALDGRIDHHPMAAARAERFMSSSWSEAAADLTRFLHNTDRNARTAMACNQAADENQLSSR